MQQFFEFFSGLFDTSHWPARWKCGTWSDFHGWLYIISDLTIWVAYFLLPVIIINYFTTKKSAIRFHKAYILFAAFILLCGATHFLDAMMFWVPAYRLNALVRFLTAVVSMATVYTLVQILPQINRQRTSMELEKEIALREHAERELSEANIRLAAFASIASHDLQEPVRKLRTFAGMVYAKNEKTFDAPSKLNMEKIISSAERMQALIKNVLKLSTFSEAVVFTTFNARDAVDRSMENLELIISEKNAIVDVGQLPVIRGNLDYLTQVFSNLISNAIKFNGLAPVIHITGEKVNDQVWIRVIDNGIGLNTEYHKKIFEPFERAHSKQKYEGAGIGLAICKRVMEIHRGSIKVQNNSVVGTTFLLVFPA